VSGPGRGRATVDVRKATGSDTPRLAEVLARSFFDDPVLSWMTPDEERRRRKGPLGFATWLERIYLPKGEVYTDADRRGAALWSPPGKWRIPVGLQLRLAPRFVRLYGLSRTPLLLRGLAQLDRSHPDDRPHWYLAVLGTDPDHQGTGVGSALVQPVLDRCDAEGLGAYLESSKEANVPFYRRHGFEVTGEVRLPEGPPLWPMWREPL
jgi:ribosomal protein S18 acetylase RimI-like enzyme